MIALTIATELGLLALAVASLRATARGWLV